MPVLKQITEDEALDRLVREDMALGKEIEKIERARDTRMKYYAQKMREETEPFEKNLGPLKEKRNKVREAILAVWTENHDDKTTLDLPCAKVSRRNYRELAVHDKEALLNALDRADRLDLVDYVFDEKAVAALIAKGELPGLPEGAAEVIDNYNLQVRPNKEKRSEKRLPTKA